MSSILNLTQHAATKEQVAAGVVEPTAVGAEMIRGRLTFDSIPTAAELRERALQLVEIAEDQHPDDGGGRRVMIGGAPFFMEPLAHALREHSFLPVFAFSRRESVEFIGMTGDVEKRSVFRHLGFVNG